MTAWAGTDIFPAMISPSLSRRSWAFLALATLTTLFLGGCATTQQGSYHAVAYQPLSKKDEIVKVSLKLQMVYVMEGDKCLLATPTCVGKPGYPTPKGNFQVMSKKQDKRSSTYGYWTNGTESHPGASANRPAGGNWTYVGYPMAFWVEFAPGYGFHEGPVWPYPRSHGCLHLHPAASAKFFQLVEVGTPVIIADKQPEDMVFGANVKRPADYADPDPAPALMISPSFFQTPRESDLLPQPGTGTGTPPS